ncbi:MAG: hypothetical protein ACR2GC_09465 [Methyloceanibacter sp.]|uniref:hypothetical protein n=1 Tax=Methyloceanibacter sp. TaxID=1965321 RepID=UPI003D9B67A0
MLGLLGNTGNTDAPHLHFHVMDGPSPLLSNGLPYVFTGFNVDGRVTDEEPLFKGSTVTIEKMALSGPFEDRLPSTTRWWTSLGPRAPAPNFSRGVA